VFVERRNHLEGYDDITFTTLFSKTVERKQTQSHVSTAVSTVVTLYPCVVAQWCIW